MQGAVGFLISVIRLTTNMRRNLPLEFFLNRFRFDGIVANILLTTFFRSPRTYESVSYIGINNELPVDIGGVFVDRWHRCRSISGRCIYSRRLVRLRNRKRLRRKCYGVVRTSCGRHYQLSTWHTRYTQLQPLPILDYRA